VEETQFEVESSESGTRGRQSTLTFGYLMGNGEESGIVEPNRYYYEHLVGMFQLRLKKGKTY
jgi:hypothetical protein